MWKAMLAGVSMIAIAGSSLVYAQPRGPAGEAQQFQRGPSAEDQNALVDARIAALRAVLKLTPEQEKDWSPVEQAIRSLAQQRFEHMQARRNAPPPASPIERLRQRADSMTDRAAGLRRLADAAQPLYQSLDESQKRRLAFVMRRGMGMHRGMHHGMMRGGMGPEGGMGPGGMGPGRGMGPGGGMAPGMGPGRL